MFRVVGLQVRAAPARFGLQPVSSGVSGLPKLKPPTGGKIIAQHHYKAIIPHTFRVQVWFRASLGHGRILSIVNILALT